MEKTLLQNSYNNLTEEKDQFQNSYNDLSKIKDQLESESLVIKVISYAPVMKALKIKDSS